MLGRVSWPILRRQDQGCRGTVVRCFPGCAILLLGDRAPWHKGQARQFVEAHPQLDMLYFPSGCPDLNPQEHVWNQTREVVGHL